MLAGSSAMGAFGVRFFTPYDLCFIKALNLRGLSSGLIYIVIFI